jgi:hypothetical protein
VGARVTRIGLDRLDRDPLHTDHKFSPSDIEAKRTGFDLRWLRITLRLEAQARLMSRRSRRRSVWLAAH